MKNQTQHLMSAQKHPVFCQIQMISLEGAGASAGSSDTKKWDARQTCQNLIHACFKGHSRGGDHFDSTHDLCLILISRYVPHAFEQLI